MGWIWVVERKQMMKLRLSLSEEGQAMREMEVGREGDGGGGRKDKIGEAVEKKRRKKPIRLDRTLSE